MEEYMQSHGQISEMACMTAASGAVRRLRSIQCFT